MQIYDINQELTILFRFLYLIVINLLFILIHILIFLYLLHKNQGITIFFCLLVNPYYNFKNHFMKHRTDIEIAQSKELLHIKKIAEKLKIKETDLEMYGNFKAKLPLELIDDEEVAKNNLILVTAITPTPAGEGKTTVSIGLTEGLNKIGKQATVVLREPSLGPVFGIKGGAAGGGYSQVVPMEDINLHFTGDFNAIEKANNLLSALIDNNLQCKNRGLKLDPRTILWKRVIDMNDRSLRQISNSKLFNDI